MKKNIRLLFLHSGAELYGADQILLKLLSNLDKSKFEPFVVLPEDGPLVEKIKEIEVNVAVIPYPIIRRKYFNPIGIIKYFFKIVKSLKLLKKYINENDIDIIHNNTIAVLEGLYLKKVTNAVLITHIHEMLEHPKIIAKILYGTHLKNADKVIVVSEAVKEHIKNNMNCDIKNVSVIHNGVEETTSIEIPANKYYNEFKIKSNSKIVGVIGRINAIKGQDDFIEAMKNVIKNNDNVYGLIVGDAFSGQEWRVSEMKRKIHDLNLDEKIIYAGFREDVKEIYQIIDVLVLSSIAYDSFPTVVLEAMSHGIPTVAYKCGGVEEMIEDSVNGYLVDIHDTEELSNKIKNIIENNNIRKKMSDNSIDIFNRNFTISKFIKDFTELYESCVITNGEKRKK